MINIIMDSQQVLHFKQDPLQKQEDNHQSDDQKKQDPRITKKFQDLRQSLLMKQQNENLFRKLSNFVYSKQPKIYIKKICQSLKSIMKDSQRYREIIDNMIIIFKYLYKISKTRKLLAEEQKEKFQQKLNNLQKYLNNKDVNLWIKYIQQNEESMINKLHFQIKKYKDLEQLLKKYQKDEQINRINVQKIQNIENIILQNKYYSNHFGQTCLQQTINTILQDNQEFRIKIAYFQQKSYQESQRIPQQFYKLLKQYSIEGPTLSDQIVNLNKYILNLQNKIKINTNKINTINDIYNKKQEQIAQLKIKQQNNNKKIQKYLKSIKMIKIQYIKDNSNILKQLQNNQNIFKIQQWMERNNIKKQQNIKYMRKQLLFSSTSTFDKKNLQFMWKQPKILILVKLKNQMIVGAYSEQIFYNDCYGQNGFLFNLTKEQMFQRSKNSKILMDKNQIILGNKQFCIKPKQMKFFTNFGLKNGHFNNKDKTYEDFIGLRNIQEINVIEFEVYKINYF